MDSTVQGYFEAGLAPSTKRSYQSGINCFLGFCNSYHIHTPLPVTQSTLCYFISALAKEGLSYSTISYLSAVRHLHILYNLPEPKSIPMPKLSLVERGIRKSAGKAAPRLPISPDILCQIRALWSSSAEQRDTITVWAVCITCFCGFFRLGELVASSPHLHNPLLFSDIAINSRSDPSTIEIHLRQSKTDPFNKGISVYLGRSGNDLCPVAALLAYLALRGGADGPLFCHPNGSPVLKSQVVNKVRAALRTLGLEDRRYAGHSFRIGAATTATERGLKDSLIKMLGRWESEAFQSYLQTPRQRLAAITKVLTA